MADETIMLAVTCEPDKVCYPAELSIKLDGVAADFYKTPNGWVVQSRQGEPLPSAAHILAYLNQRFSDTEVNTHIVGELTVMGEDVFKNAAGIIRRQVMDERIVLNVYDMYIVGKEAEIYEHRVLRMNALVKQATKMLSDGPITWRIIRRVPVTGVVENAQELIENFASMDDMMSKSPLFEGFVVRALRGSDSAVKVGKRSRGLMRHKPKPTLDLQVVAFEEATANKDIVFLGKEFKKGEGLGAVGRVVMRYRGMDIGVGPGCLTHKERQILWERYQALLARGEVLFDKNLIGEVEYMKDDNYTALRQPILKRWRTDKTEPSEIA